MIRMTPHEERRRVSYDLPLTPMIDVVFLLIIFFVSIEFKRITGELELLLPKYPGAIRRLPPEEVFIDNLIRVKVDVPETWGPRTEVDPDTREERFVPVGQPVDISIDGEPVGSYLALEATLTVRRQEIKETGKTPMIVLDLHPRLRYQNVVSTINAAKRADFKSISFTPPAEVPGK